MIVPTKHLRPQDSLLGSGGVVLNALRKPRSVSELWSRLRDEPTVSSYERLILTLDMLFVLGAVEYNEGVLSRQQR